MNKVTFIVKDDDIDGKVGYAICNSWKSYGYVTTTGNNIRFFRTLKGALNYIKTNFSNLDHITGSKRTIVFTSSIPN